MKENINDRPLGNEEQDDNVLFQATILNHLNNLCSTLPSLLTPQLIDLLASEHERVDCSDQNTCNGFNSSKPGTRVKCVRCTLLQCYETKTWSDTHLIDIDITRINNALEISEID